MSFEGLWKQHEAQVDLGALRGELAKLRVALQAEAQDADQAISLGEVAHAEKAADAGNGARMLEHLHQAGPWALKVARETKGVDAASQVLALAVGR